MPWDEFNAKGSPPEVIRGWELIGAAVTRRRTRLCLSQPDLERRSGISQSSISKLENGRLRAMNWARFARLVEALDGLDFGSPTILHWIGLDARMAERAAAVRVDL